MLLRHDSGAVSVVECTYEARRDPDPFPETLVEIEGPRGSIVVDAGCRMTLTSDGKASESDIGAPLLSWTSHPWHVSQEGALGACRHFLDCLQRGVPAETSGADNLRSYALVDAAYRAAAEARRRSHRNVGAGAQHEPFRQRAGGRSARRWTSRASIAKSEAAARFRHHRRLRTGRRRHCRIPPARSPRMPRCRSSWSPDCLRFDVLTPADQATDRASVALRDLSRPRGLRPASGFGSYQTFEPAHARPGAAARPSRPTRSRRTPRRRRDMTVARTELLDAVRHGRSRLPKRRLLTPAR